MNATFSNVTAATTNEPNRLIHQLQDGPDISLDGDSIVFNPNDDDIRGKFGRINGKLLFFFEPFVL